MEMPCDMCYHKKREFVDWKESVMQEDTIDLRELMHIIRKRLGLIALITLLAVLVTGFVSAFVLDKQYEAYTQLIINKPADQSQPLTYNDVMLNQKLVDTYSIIAKSNTVLEQVMQQLDLNMPLKELNEKITVSGEGETEIIRITAKDTDPQMAAAIADKVGEVFMAEVVKKMKIDNVQVIDPARVPEEASQPKTLLNVAIAAVLGLMVSLGIVFLQEYLDNTIKTPDDVQKYLGLPVLGSVPSIPQD
jgi:capsular polysaccharide biosynthesis protein